MDGGDTAGVAIEVSIASPRRDAVAALRTALRSHADLRLLDDCVTCPAGVPTCRDPRARVLLLDELLVADLDARCLPAWRQQPGLRVLLWCDDADSRLVERVLAHGFRGFVRITQPPEVSAKAIRAVHRGELWLPRGLLAEAVEARLEKVPADWPVPPTHPSLTPREAEVVAQLRRGASNKEIARDLGIMEDTVKKHLQSVFAKLGVHRRSMLMLQAPVS